MNGSYNHLRAFVSNLSAQTGETYQPQYLSAETYQSIIGARLAGNGGRERTRWSVDGGGGGCRGGRP